MRYYKTHISSFNHIPLTYSVDKIVLLGFLEYNKIDYLLSAIDKLYYKHLNITCKNQMSVPWVSGDLFYWSTTHYENKKNLSFNHNFSFELKDGITGELNTFWLGLGFNRFGNIDYTRWKLEFNSNKVLPCEFTAELLQLLIVNSYDISLKEYDIAIDLPLNRKCFTMSTNNGRKYALIYNNDWDKTEYSGMRHTNGFTKIYNKTLESKLKSDLTRIEFTFTETNYKKAIIGLPDIYITDYKQLEIDGVGDINDTEKFILNTLIERPTRINELGRYMKQKMKNILAYYIYTYTLTEKDFYKTLDILKSIPIVKVALK